MSSRVFAFLVFAAAFFLSVATIAPGEYPGQAPVSVAAAYADGPQSLPEAAEGQTPVNACFWECYASCCFGDPPCPDYCAEYCSCSCGGPCN